MLKTFGSSVYFVVVVASNVCNFVYMLRNAKEMRFFHSVRDVSMI